MTTRRLALLFDGTLEQARIHVERLRQLIAPSDAAGVPQRVNYLPGAGASPGITHLLGGASDTVVGPTCLTAINGCARTGWPATNCICSASAAAPIPRAASASLSENGCCLSGNGTLAAISTACDVDHDVDINSTFRLRPHSAPLTRSI